MGELQEERRFPAKGARVPERDMKGGKATIGSRYIELTRSQRKANIVLLGSQNYSADECPLCSGPCMSQAHKVGGADCEPSCFPSSGLCQHVLVKHSLLSHGVVWAGHRIQKPQQAGRNLHADLFNTIYVNMLPTGQRN